MNSAFEARKNAGASVNSISSGKPATRANERPGLVSGPAAEKHCQSLNTISPPGQAAGLKIFEALVLIGSALSAATFWVSSASCRVCAVKASNWLRACEVHSSSASEGDLTPTSACAKSRLADAACFVISITLAEYSLAPLLNTENTASIVLFWVSAASLNRA